MSYARAGLVVGCFAVLSGSLVSAGQLHVSYYGLKEVRAQREMIIVGKVKTAQQDKRRVTVTLEVMRLFGDEAVGGIKPGDSITRPIYQGVEWTDPHKSPLDQRLRGCLHGAPAIGAAVVLVKAPRGGFELLAASDEALRTLEILYAPDSAAAIAKEPAERLQLDLKNLDLAELARHELQRRGKLSAVTILEGDPQFASTHYRGLPVADKIAFLRELGAASLDRSQRVRAARTTLSELQPEVLVAAAQLVNLLDWNNPEERRALDDVRLTLQSLVDTPMATAPVDLTPMCDYLAEALLRRESYRDSDETTVRLIGRCDRSTRARLAARLLGAIYTSSRARGDDHDGFLLETAVELAREAPSGALWVSLQVLDPNRPRITSTKERILAAMIEVGVVLAKHDATYKERVRDLIGPLLGGGLSVDEKLLETYRKTIGDLPRGAPKAAILELRLGERRRLASGEVVSIKADKDGQFLNLAALDGSSEERALDAGSDFYREWLIPPYLVVVKRVGKAVHLRFSPVEKDPAISPADAYEMAKKICDRRGQRELVSQDSRDYDGLFVYIAESSGQPGKQAGKQTCKITIGLRTKRVMFAP